MPTFRDDEREWLEVDGLGGFACGTVSGVRTRRYHALLLAATTPPTGRVVLVNGFDAWWTTPGARIPLSSQRYVPGAVHPDGASRIAAFDREPWPTWTYRVGDRTVVRQEIVAARGTPGVIVRWTAEGDETGTLEVRPFLSGRDYHALHRENTAARLSADEGPATVAWRPYDGIPGAVAATNGSYRHDPCWYRQFHYLAEQRRGLDDVEDLLAPGVFSWALRDGPAYLVLGTAEAVPAFRDHAAVAAYAEDRCAAELARRKRLGDPLDRAADAYLVRRGRGSTIIAGYPWFTDWGRDTFIALRGLCLATRRFEEARRILLEWSEAVDRGMLPNRFPDAGETPEFNASDASLWFVVAVHELRAAADGTPGALSGPDWTRLRAAVDAILEGYMAGTRYGIRCEADGLLAAGAPGVQLTWMDARVGDRVITPRIGKAVEVQALWLNALRVASAWAERWHATYGLGMDSFRARFWNERRGCLFDVVDVDHVPGAVDDSLRPNQILAAGGLPFTILEPDRARRVVDIVEATLLAPLGLRSLAPGEPGYAPRCTGPVPERDGAYHMGTVWPWLLGPFVEAWVRVRGQTADDRAAARARFVAPLLAHLEEEGLGHVSEITDAEPPHTPRGCPFQAWSMGELLRLERVVLAERSSDAGPARV